MNKNPKSKQRRTLEIKRETIVQLTDDKLKELVGGNMAATDSNPISYCATQCMRGN